MTYLDVLFAEQFHGYDATSVRSYLRECSASRVDRVHSGLGDRQKT